MKYMAEPAYSLRYDEEGNETEKNLISDLLTDPDFSIEEVNESSRLEFQIMREAIEVSRKNKYDMDFFTEYALLEVAIYKKLSGPGGITPLMPLFGKADKVDIFNYKSGKTVMLTAIYLFTGNPKKA